MNLKRLGQVFFSGVLALSVPSLVSATVLTMDEGTHYSSNYDDGGMGSGRGIGFLANQNISMTALAIDLNVDVPEVGVDYEFEIYSSADGINYGALLDQISFNLIVGAGYQDQAFSFDFDAGSHYLIHFSRVDNANLGGLGTKYSWEDTNSHTPYDYGVLTMVEGLGSSSAPTNGNPLIPHLRMTYGAVPEPSVILLMGVGLVGFGLVRRRQSKV